MSPNDPEKLEAAIHRTLRSIPDRKAPAGLEGRILLELNRRAALPWWRKSFAYWPTPVRVGFFVGSAVAAAIVVVAVVQLGISTGAQQIASGFAERFAWVTMARELTASIGSKVVLVLGAIPPLWLYGAIGAVALCYATLAALGAAAYRALSFVRPTP
jgi:hypothetical protein